MKTKLILIGTIVVLLLSVFYLNNRRKVLKEDRDRIETNFLNSQFELDSTKAKNGNLIYSVETLELKIREAEKFNSELTNKVKDMGLKLKNLQSVTKIEYKYLYVTDTMTIDKFFESDSIKSFRLQHKNKWINIDQKISIKKSNQENLNKNIKETLKVDSLKIKLIDDLIIAYDINYKRRWIFWKKPVSVEVNVLGENPYLKIDRIESISLIEP